MNMFRTEKGMARKLVLFRLWMGCSIPMVYGSLLFMASSLVVASNEQERQGEANERDQMAQAIQREQIARAEAYQGEQQGDGLHSTQAGTSSQGHGWTSQSSGSGGQQQGDGLHSTQAGTSSQGYGWTSQSSGSGGQQQGQKLREYARWIKEFASGLSRGERREFLLRLSVSARHDFLEFLSKDIREGYLRLLSSEERGQLGELVGRDLRRSWVWDPDNYRGIGRLMEDIFQWNSVKGRPQQQPGGHGAQRGLDPNPSTSGIQPYSWSQQQPAGHSGHLELDPNPSTSGTQQGNQQRGQQQPEHMDEENRNFLENRNLLEQFAEREKQINMRTSSLGYGASPQLPGWIPGNTISGPVHPSNVGTSSPGHGALPQPPGWVSGDLTSGRNNPWAPSWRLLEWLGNPSYFYCLLEGPVAGCSGGVPLPTGNRELIGQSNASTEGPVEDSAYGDEHAPTPAGRGNTNDNDVRATENAKDSDFHRTTENVQKPPNPEL
ncbi:hypothetical protein [Pasteuria penetrans]|uniref:hypothetical protein n=1 Tax=Pasteuria penetrans TaxID=86005 RepID=UPI000FA65941|nr:hypothetical protein [Pasteuria penetrans]